MEALNPLLEAIGTLVKTLQEAKAGGGSNGPTSNRLPITSRKGLQDVGKYDGKPESYPDWKTVLTGFLRCEDELFRKYVDFAEGLLGENLELTDLYAFAQTVGTSPDDLEARKTIDWYDNQLYSLLIVKTKDDALALVKSVPEDGIAKGARAWRRITTDQEGMNALRMTGLARRVMNPEKVKNFKDIVAAVEKWELQVKEFEKANKNFTLPEAMRISGLCHIVPPDMEKEIMKLPSQDFKTAKKYAYDQVAARKQPWFHGEKSSKDYGRNHQGVADMELDMMAEAVEKLEQVGKAFLTQDEVGEEEEGKPEEEQQKGELREKLSNMILALQRKGDGKGGKFPGTCHFCGKHGHKISECWAKDEQMRKGKGGGGKGFQGNQQYGGKQGFGKGRYGGGWQQGNGGGWQQGKGGVKGGYGQGGYQPNYKGGQKGGYGKGAKGGLHWCDGNHDHTGQDGWQQTQGGYRQLFSISKAQVSPPPGLTVHNMFGNFTSEDEEDFELPEAEFPRIDQQVSRKSQEFSKKKVMKQVKPKEWRPVKAGHALTLTAEPLDEPVQALQGVGWLHIDPETKWRRVRSVMDSGASDNCSPPELAHEVEIEESEGSKRGQKYAAAGGKTIDNMGQKTVNMVTQVGQPVVGTWQIAEVLRPLNSVMKICKNGNRVIFEESGGYIENLYTGEVTEFGTEGDIYTLDLWLPPEGHAGVKGGKQDEGGTSSGFPGPGWRR